MDKFKVDFSGVEDSGFKTITKGRYLAVVEDISREEGAKAPYVKWDLKIAKGEFKGNHITLITSLSPNALFRLRDTLEAFGVKVPKSAVVIDPKKFIGKPIGIDVNMREYEGKEYPNIKDVFPAAEFDAPAKPSAVELDTTEGVPFDMGGTSTSTGSGDELSIDLD